MRIGFLFLPLILVTLACGGGSNNSSPSNANVITASAPPPALPQYMQPVAPAVGVLWSPGYWAYDVPLNDYYWVPGTWVRVPQPNLLWTPPYWAWNGTVFVFHEGWWGPQVGFYGGIAYGFGYSGSGFQGGYWQGGQLYYNQAVSNVAVSVVRNVYSAAVVNNVEISRVSYNGGDGGIVARPTSEEIAAIRVKSSPATAEQLQHVEAARTNPDLRASINHGSPSVTATSRPGIIGSKAEPQERPVPPKAEQPQRPQASTNHKETPPAATTKPDTSSGRPVVKPKDDLSTKAARRSTDENSWH